MAKRGVLVGIYASAGVSRFALCMHFGGKSRVFAFLDAPIRAQSFTVHLLAFCTEMHFARPRRASLCLFLIWRNMILNSVKILPRLPQLHNSNDAMVGKLFGALGQSLNEYFPTSYIYVERHEWDQSLFAYTIRRNDL